MGATGVDVVVEAPGDSIGYVVGVVAPDARVAPLVDLGAEKLGVGVDLEDDGVPVALRLIAVALEGSSMRNM